jgi:hypothetical protein
MLQQHSAHSAHVNSEFRKQNDSLGSGDGQMVSVRGLRPIGAVQRTSCVILVWKWRLSASFYCVTKHKLLIRDFKTGSTTIKTAYGFYQQGTHPIANKRFE